MEGSIIKQGLAEIGFVVRNDEICGHLKDGRPLICVQFKHKASFKYYKHLLPNKCTVFHHEGHWTVVCLAPIGASALRAPTPLAVLSTAERLLGFEAVAVPSFSLDGLQYVDASAGVPYLPETVWRVYFGNGLNRS